MWLEHSTPIEIDGLQYLVRAVSFENGRADAMLMPAVPLQLVDHEWRGPTHGAETTAPPDDTAPSANHVRDAVEAT
jgi:hypothetical protein